MIKERKLALKCLAVADIIEIETRPFSKKLFFDENNPIKCDSLWSWPAGCAFDNWIFKDIPNTAPAFKGILLKTLKTRLRDRIYDTEILNELGNPKLFTIKEFFAIISCLLYRQFKGQNGLLLNDGSNNIFHFKLKDLNLAAHLRWYPEAHNWGFGVGEFATKSSNGYRPDGKCAIFSRC